MALSVYLYERPARKHFRWWHNWAVRSRLEPIIQVARMLKRRFENVVTFLRRRLQREQRVDQRQGQSVKYTAPAVGTKRTSFMRSTSTAVAWTSLQPLNSRKREKNWVPSGSRLPVSLKQSDMLQLRLGFGPFRCSKMHLARMITHCKTDGRLLANAATSTAQGNTASFSEILRQLSVTDALLLDKLYDLLLSSSNPL